MADGVFDLVVVVAPLLDLVVLPLLEPVPLGEGHQRAGGLALRCHGSGSATAQSQGWALPVFFNFFTN